MYVWVNNKIPKKSNKSRNSCQWGRCTKTGAEKKKRICPSHPIRFQLRPLRMNEAIWLVAKGKFPWFIIRSNINAKISNCLLVQGKTIDLYLSIMSFYPQNDIVCIHYYYNCMLTIDGLELPILRIFMHLEKFYIEFELIDWLLLYSIQEYHSTNFYIILLSS